MPNRHYGHVKKITKQSIKEVNNGKMATTASKENDIGL